MRPTKQLAIVLLLMISARLQAQDKTVNQLKKDAGKTITKDASDTIPQIWKVGGIVGLNVSQASLSNWAPGGDEFSLSLNSLVSLYAFYKRDRHSWDNTFDFSLGYIKTTSLGSRKNDDRFELVSKYGYAISSKWNISGLFNFRSQMFDGYTYAKDDKTFSSAFLSPAYLLLGAGFDFRPDQHFSLFLSPATARLTIVNDDTLSAKGLYGVEAGEHHHWEFGAFVSATYLKEFNKILSYKGKLDLFSNYKHNPQNVDLYMTNLFAAKLSNWLTANWNFDLVYDDDTKLFGDKGTSPALQMKSLIGVGLLVKFNNR